MRQWSSERMRSIAKTTVWAEFTGLAMEHKAVNLGQGFPSWAPPPFVQKEYETVGSEAATLPLQHQYCRSLGHPELVTALAAKYSKSLNRPVDAMKEVLITNGSTQGLYCAFQTFVGDGDEVIIFEPFFDLYMPDIHMAGGKTVLIPLRPTKGAGGTSQDWKYDPAELERAFNSRTKLVVINTPQNVPGKVWSRAELEHVAALVKKHDCFVVMDEVYEYMVYGGAEHVQMATLDGMWDRTITVGSAGKTFSCTGWKIGWCVAPSEAIQAMLKINSHIVFCVSTPFQIAIGRTISETMGNSYHADLISMYSHKRQRLCDMLATVGLTPTIPDGAYFALANIAAVPEHLYVDAQCPDAKDYQFCRWLTKEYGVTAIPVSAFYSPANRAVGAQYVRFAFCKDDADIDEAGRRLERLRQLLKGGNSKL
eukprot:PhM_4_TR8347/c1_g1_i2/m.17818/K00816/CCBL; kynurenine---oxoglutarate transaminase / cysteine-S-conjugate beta-lyase / glutamine---phenylpyruvate transaminase